MYTGEQAAKPVKEPTLNDRLNKVAGTIAYQLDRIESTLGRVNGTPPAPTPIKGEGTAPRPPHSLAQVVEMLEQQSQRLANLSTGVEDIA